MSGVDWILEPGGRVLLETDGQTGVPAKLHRTWAVVVKVHRSLVSVRTEADHQVRRVRRTQIKAYLNPPTAAPYNIPACAEPGCTTATGQALCSHERRAALQAVHGITPP